MEPYAPAPAPRISVVMATYDRSNIIGYTIRCLQAQTMQDWELIVVGDACTDDTEAVVAAFGDPRIRYHALARNCGEQSGPNNAGVALARAPWLAFLNHDDFWLPHHLERLLAALEASGDDLAFSLGLQLLYEGAQRTLVGATTQHGVYHPALVVPASLWLLRRALAERVGAWRPAATLRVAPSQDWLYRAHREGARLRAVPEVTAVLVASGGVANSYRDRRAEAHAYWFARCQSPDFVLEEVLALQLAWEDARLRDGGGRLFAEALRAAARWLLRRLGVFPPLPAQWLRFARRGSYVRHLRRVRGLTPDAAPRGGRESDAG